MARTVADAIVEARILLQDQEEPYRTSDAELIRYLNNSFTEIRRMRPDLFVGYLQNDFPEFTTGGTDLPYPISEMYFTASVNYMTAMADARDAQSIDDGRSGAFLTMFANQLKVG